MSDMTARLGLPTIRAGQAQKELSHNEALAVIDLLLHASVVAAGVNTPPTTPVAGQAWLVGAAPTGSWTGWAQHVAGWTEGGWRFAAPAEGMAIWSSEASVIARYSGGTWAFGELRGNHLTIDGLTVVGARGAAVPTPVAGSVIDVEARTAIAGLLSRLRAHGLIAN